MEVILKVFRDILRINNSYLFFMAKGTSMRKDKKKPKKDAKKK